MLYKHKVMPRDVLQLVSPLRIQDQRSGLGLAPQLHIGITRGDKKKNKQQCLVLPIDAYLTYLMCGPRPRIILDVPPDDSDIHQGSGPSF